MRHVIISVISVVAGALFFFLYFRTYNTIDIQSILTVPAGIFGALEVALFWVALLQSKESDLGNFKSHKTSALLCITLAFFFLIGVVFKEIILVM